MTESTRWALPLLSAGQAQKEITHNEALLAIDRLLQLGVVSRRCSAPPENAASGEIHIVGAAASGAWAGNEGQLASFDGSGWTFVAPRPGCLAWIDDEQEFAVMTASGWSQGGWPASAIRIGGRSVLAASPSAVAPTTGGETVDDQCRSTVAALLVVLRSQGVIG